MVNFKYLNNFFLYVFAFLFIFNPTIFFDFNLIYILFVVSLIYLLFNFNKLVFFISNKRVFILISYIFFMIFYCLILYFLFNEDALYRAYTLLLLLMALLISFTIVCVYKKTYGFDFNLFIKFLINIGVIQIVIVIFTIISPELREFILSAARQEDTMLLDIANNEVGVRSFGLSQNYTSSLPMLMGVYTIFTLYYFFYEKKINIKLYYLILTVGFGLSVVLNARIGAIPIVLSFLIFYLSLIFQFYKINKFYFFVFATFFISILFYFLNGYMGSELLRRFKFGMEEVLLLLNGEMSGTFLALKDMLVFPSTTINFLFGQGYETFGKNSLSSDIGFVRDIFMFGLVGVVFQIFVFLYVFNNKLLKLNKLIYIILVLSLLAYYFKGLIFSANELHNFLLLLLSFVIMRSYFFRNT